MLMHSKKGVSPLIATVLLLAFAVALATVIVQIYPSGECNLKGVQVSSVNGAQRICFNQANKEVEMFIENMDKKDIIGFKIKAAGELEVLNIEHIPLRVKQKEEKKLRFAYDDLTYGKIVSLEVFPQINKSNQPHDCEMSGSIVSIPLCG